MAIQVDLESVCAPSEDVVAREIEGEVLIVPLAAGVGNSEDELYTLNESGQAIWKELDGQRSLKDVVRSLADKFDAPLSGLENDVLGFVNELARRGILVAKP
ncbi:MAG: PqqD family protein [Bradyrhizobium sp.]